MEDSKSSSKNAIGGKIISLVDQEELIPSTRKNQLYHLAAEISKQIKEAGFVKVIFICTHNSRRSQLAEIWLHTACEYFGVEDIHTFSGGTEATSFNPRMVDAVRRFGFQLDTSNQSDNPVYVFQSASRTVSKKMFSKRYNHDFNPQNDYIAVMVCSEADEDCPVVIGAVARFAVPYEDPKAFDGSRREQIAYDNKVEEIGREMLYLVKMIKADLD